MTLLTPKPTFFSRSTAASLLLLLLASTLPAWSQDMYVSQDELTQSQQADEEPPATYYTNYSEQAMEAYRKGESTKAIDLMLKAFQLAPNNTAVINNLAASFIQRGVYFQNTKKDYAKAAADYRQALFYLEHEWPADASKTATSEANINIIQDNLEGALKSVNAPLSDWKWHLKTAWDLRRKGNLQEAMIEYAWTTRLNPKSSEAWTAQGDIYTVRQKPAKAITTYQKAVDTASAPSDTLYVKLGTAFLQNSNPEKAVEAYNRALAINPKSKDALLGLEQVWNKEIVLNPRNMSAHLNLGAVYQQLNRFDDAHAQYQVADRLAPNNTLIKLNLASLYQAQNQLDKANAMIDAVLQQEPANSKALIIKGDILKQQGRPQDAEQALQRALNTSSDKKAVLDQLLAVYKAQGDTAKLRQGWERYAATFPQDADVQYQAGLTLHEAKAYDGAIQYYQKAIQLKPNFADAYANLGTAYHALKKDDDALKALKKAAQLNPNLEEVQTLIAALESQKGSQAFYEAAKLHEQGQYREALKQYEIAIKEDPKNADIQARYGLALQALKRFPEAVAAYDKAIALQPDVAAHYYYKGSVYDEQNQLAPARQLYEKALSLDPQLEQAKSALAALQTASTDTTLAESADAYDKKNYVLALQKADAAIKSDPNNAMAYYYKGLALEAQKKLEPARLAYQKSVELDPAMSDAVYALAVVLDTQGKKADAQKTFQQFLTLTKDQPEDDFIKYAKSRLN